MKFSSRVLFYVAVSHSTVMAENAPSGGFFEGVKSFFVQKKAETESKPQVQETAATSTLKDDSSATAPTLGVWGTLNRFFKKKHPV